MKISFHGQSCVLIEHDGIRTIIDPFITGNDLSDLKADEIEVDFILLTHGHNDHLGDTVSIAKRNHATVIAPFEVANFLSEKGINTMGGSGDYSFGSVKFVQAHHSSSYEEEGQVHYMGVATGLILKIADKTIYHTGDTWLFGDMKLIADRNGPIDVLFIPIGDHYTMGVDDASYAANEFVKPSIVVPIHYNTFPPIQQNPQNFKDQINSDIDCQILKAGEKVSFK
ncbi:metal-dependent hydrolase [Fundicoccus sp. Sow4_H7]|uniref:metal-dependent hydrolase n=1 Tax=Fundicoccus sp. Sow4_H7 TaxID=3438784 RepID=UPI003F8E51B3